MSHPPIFLVRPWRSSRSTETREASGSRARLSKGESPSAAPLSGTFPRMNILEQITGPPEARQKGLKSPQGSHLPSASFHRGWRL